jgi:predicted RNA polymerase sigma factor
LADGVGEIATATVRDIHDVPISVEECAASADDHGALVPLEEQDRGLWDGDAIGQATTLLDAVLRRGQPGPNQLRGAAPPATPPAPTAPRPTD